MDAQRCTNCDLETLDFYRRCPRTGREVQLVLCRDCYEMACTLAQRDRWRREGDFEEAVSRLTFFA